MFVTMINKKYCVMMQILIDINGGNFTGKFFYYGIENFFYILYHNDSLLTRWMYFSLKRYQWQPLRDKNGINNYLKISMTFVQIFWKILDAFNNEKESLLSFWGQTRIGVTYFFFNASKTYCGSYCPSLKQVLCCRSPFHYSKQ